MGFPASVDPAFTSIASPAPDMTRVHAAQGNTRPVANFTITPAVGSALTVFTFNASLSHDAEDSLDRLLFRWDLYDDARWEIEWSQNPIATWEAGPPGGLPIRLEVRDTGLLTGSLVRELNIVGTSTPLFARGFAQLLLLCGLTLLAIIGVAAVLWVVSSSAGTTGRGRR